MYNVHRMKVKRWKERGAMDRKKIYGQKEDRGLERKKEIVRKKRYGKKEKG